LTNKEIYAVVKKPTTTETAGYIDCVGLGMYREWTKIDFPEEYCV
jgi:hypothetical protein